jgi:hypothetical protein
MSLPARCLTGLMVVSLLLVAGAPLARAADCPSAPPATLKDRRALAKEWFTRAETEELGGDDKAAVKAYSCSFAMLPHPSTAYNLARAAERSGEPALALSALRDYLTLKPTATDRTEIEERIRVLEGRLAAPTPPSTPAPSPAPSSPTPTATPEPEPAAVPAAPPPRRRAVRTTEDTPREARMGTTEWIIAGVGAAALAAGVVFNVGARSAMSDCRAKATGNQFSEARDACDRAKTYAYLSYGLFAAAGAAAVLDVTLVLGKNQPVETVGMLVVPSGAGLSATGRF